MHDLATFIRARLDEDEQAAFRAGDEHPCWEYNRDRFEVHTAAEDGYPIATRRGETNSPLCDVDGEHIARHDPARVLREVEAKRKLLAYLTEEIVDCTCEAYGHHEDTGLRLLGACWADHPDYQPRWAPAAA